jgi:hypothetical protein
VIVADFLTFNAGVDAGLTHPVRRRAREVIEIRSSALADR